MATSVIGALRVALGMDSAEFEKGADSATRRSKRFEKDLAKSGQRISGIGKRMSLAVTGPLLAVGAAFGTSAHKMAADAKEIRNAADVAGEGFEEFQRHAFAAREVGIEFDKLGDIFKDVRDRIGDFVATGAGPMADFFENIGPKVGVTIDQFKGLGGKDALQLYVNSLEKANVSQEEMVFYLEAISGDATALLPLLRENGKAMRDMGQNAAIISDSDAERLHAYTAAQRQMNNSMKELTITLVNSGLLEIITSLVRKVADFTSDLSETNPALLKIIVIVGAIVAAVGPAVIVIGSLVSTFSALLPVLTKLPVLIGAVRAAMTLLLGNPIILAAAAVIGGIYLAWQNWDKIQPIIDRVTGAVLEFWNTHVGPIFTVIKSTVLGAIQWWAQMHLGAARALAGLATAAGRWLRDKLGGTMEWVRGKIEMVEQAFAWLYDRVVGNSHIPDMVQEIGQSIGQLEDVMVKPVGKATSAAEQSFRTMAQNVKSLLDRLFPEIARIRKRAAEESLLRDAHRRGILSDNELDAAMGRLQREGFYSGKSKVSDRLLNTQSLVDQSAMERVTTAFAKEMEQAGEKVTSVNARIVESFQQLVDRSLSSLDQLARGIKGGGILDIVGGLLGALDSIGALVTGGKGFNLFGAVFGKNPSPAAVPGYANGGGFQFGGKPGVDQNLLSLNGTPIARVSKGEHAYITPTGRMGGGDGMVRVIVSANDYFDARVQEVSGGVVAAAAPGLIRSGGAEGVARMQKLNSRRLA